MIIKLNLQQGNERGKRWLHYGVGWRASLLNTFDSPVLTFL